MINCSIFVRACEVGSLPTGSLKKTHAMFFVNPAFPRIVDTSEKRETAQRGWACTLVVDQAMHGMLGLEPEAVP